jgi:hypothetical protein
MGQQHGKQQKPIEEKEKGNNSAVKKKFAFFNVQQKKTNLHHRRLPLEMECEIFKFLKEEIQTKLIWEMGNGIYGMFRLKVLTKVCQKNRRHYLCNYILLEVFFILHEISFFPLLKMTFAFAPELYISRLMSYPQWGKVTGNNDG